MFGYIRPFKPEMKMREFETYQSFYCGLCKQMGRSFGWMSRLTLSYDFSFLAILEMAVTQQQPDMKSERCIFNPLKKKMCCQQCHGLEFSGDMAVLMLYYKLQDNIDDDGFWKSLMWRAAMPFVKPAYKKASAKHPEMALVLSQINQQQRNLEQARCNSVDQAAEPTAQGLKAIFSSLCEDKSQKLVLGQMGYFLGKYVYLCDALDDLEEDWKKDGYNPFLISMGKDSTEEQREEIIEQARGILYMTIAEAIKAYELLQVYHYQGILDNIFYLGLRSTANLLEHKKHQKNEKP